jgi:hypothetical protein
LTTGFSPISSYINTSSPLTPINMLRFISTSLFLVWCFFSSILTAQQSYGEPLDAYGASFLPEKVFVHTDKRVYAGGETIYAAVYLLSGLSHQPNSLSKTIYLELIGPGGTLESRLHIFAANGHTAATLILPADIIPGDYHLTAYTNYQRNTYPGGLFRKSLRIVGGLKESGGAGDDGLFAVSDSITSTSSSTPLTNLRFFPESGDCTMGVPCRVALTSAIGNGTPVNFSGTLLTDDGLTSQTVSTNERGIGSFTYTPTSNRMTVTDALTGREYRLPKPKPSGGHIRVDVTTDTIDITIHNNEPQNGLRDHVFVLHLRGVGLLEQPFTQASTQFKMRLPVTLLPAGVIIASLLDAEGNAVAERLFFIPPRETTIKVALDRQQYGLRSPVNLSLIVPREQLADSLNTARLSVSVLPAASAGGPTGDDIRTWVLLNSDVDHPVQQAPELIFGNGTPTEKARRIDDFLLTRAWRRFRWEQLPELSDYQPAHLLERGLFIRGRMTKFDFEDVPRPGKIFLTRMANAFNDETLTDEAGYFTLGPYITTDTFPVLLQGRFKPGRKNRLNPGITLEDNKAAKLEVFPYTGVDWSDLPTTKEVVAPKQQLVDYAEISRRTLTVARNFDSLIVDLQTIDVSAKRIDAVEEAREDRTRQFYSEPTRRVVVADDAYAQTTPFLLDVLSKLNGVRRFTDSEGAIFFNVRNAESVSGGPIPAGVYLDGQLTRIGRLAAIQMAQVEFIDVLTQQRAVRLGADAEGGAIMIFLYPDGRALGEEQGVLETTLAGYHTVREFASFDPTLPKNRNRPDYRTTLYWAPLLYSDSNGEAGATFNTSDQTGEFHIFVQGLRNDGTPLYGEGLFEVNSER